jgi:hypothetical protein
MAAAVAAPAHAPAMHDATMADPKHASNEQNIHTPPASDMSSHGRKGDDDDDDDGAASSSILSDLDDQFEEAPQPASAQDVPKEKVPVAVEPDRYDGGIPIFQPVCYFWNDPVPPQTRSLPPRPFARTFERMVG